MEHSTKFLLYLVIVVASVYTVESISCYQCNSGKLYEGKPCETDFKQFMSECSNSTYSTKNYTRCRKTVQTVGDDTRTIRSCATAGTSGSSCVDRTGTASVRVKYCECNTENCNRSSGILPSILLVFVVALSNPFANAFVGRLYR